MSSLSPLEAIKPVAIRKRVCLRRDLRPLQVMSCASLRLRRSCSFCRSTERFASKPPLHAPPPSTPPPPPPETAISARLFARSSWPKCSAAPTSSSLPPPPPPPLTFSRWARPTAACSCSTGAVFLLVLAALLFAPALPPLLPLILNPFSAAIRSCSCTPSTTWTAPFQALSSRATAAT